MRDYTLYRQHEAVRSHYAETEAEVLSMLRTHQGFKTLPSTYDLTVAFSVPGHRRQVASLPGYKSSWPVPFLYAWDPPIAVGETLPIFYDPADPSWILAENDEEKLQVYLVGPVMIAVFGTIFGCFLWVLWKRIKRGA